MAFYSPELKEQIIQKMMPPNNQSIPQIHKETSIPLQTLYSWRQSYRTKGYIVPNQIKTDQLILHSDNGSPMKGSRITKTIIEWTFSTASTLSSPAYPVQRFVKLL